MRILIVEDEPIIALNIQSVLLDLGYRPLLATSVLAAYEVWEKRGFDAALLDIKLPDGDIYSFAQMLGENTVPFALLSGGEVDETRLPEGSPALQKPFSLAELEAALIRLAEQFDKTRHRAMLQNSSEQSLAAGDGSLDGQS